MFDLDENVQDSKPDLGSELGMDLELEALKQHYRVMTPTYSTDGLNDPIHVCDIK